MQLWCPYFVFFSFDPPILKTTFLVPFLSFVLSFSPLTNLRIIFYDVVLVMMMCQCQIIINFSNSLFIKFFYIFNNNKNLKIIHRQFININSVTETYFSCSSPIFIIPGKVFFPKCKPYYSATTTPPSKPTLIDDTEKHPKLGNVSQLQLLQMLFRHFSPTHYLLLHLHTTMCNAHTILINFHQ